LCPHFTAGVLTTYFVRISFLYEQICPIHASLRMTYDIFCLISFFFYEQICPSYHYCMGKNLSISRCNRYFSLLQPLDARSSLMSAVSTTHFTTIMSICFQWACMHAHAHATACICTLSLKYACMPLITAAIQMRFG
jgi:hypothetical protein